MSGNAEQKSSGESPEAAMKAAFARLGITLDDSDGGNAELQVAALNGVADQLADLHAERNGFVADRETIKSLLDAVGFEVGDLDGLPATVNEALTQLDTLRSASAETDKDLADHVVKLRDATIELASLRRQVAAQKGQATKARAEQTETAARLAEALARSDQAEPRKMPAELPIVAKADHGDLLQLIGVAEKVEIVAVADDREDVGLPALSITGGAAAFRVVSSGLCLALDRWEVVGPGKITGWALYLDDDLAAYRHRVGGQLTIGAGQTFNLASDVLF